MALKENSCSATGVARILNYTSASFFFEGLHSQDDESLLRVLQDYFYDSSTQNEGMIFVTTVITSCMKKLHKCIFLFLMKDLSSLDVDEDDFSQSSAGNPDNTSTSFHSGPVVKPKIEALRKKHMPQNTSHLYTLPLPPQLSLYQP